MITDFSHCTLEPLQRDSEFVLYRDVRARPGMLLLAPAQDHVSPMTLARLEHEYSLAGELDRRWAARPVTLGWHEGRIVLALEDPGGEPLSRLLGMPMELDAFLPLAIGLARAVGGLHAARSEE